MYTSTCQKKGGRIAVIGGNDKYASERFVRYSRWWNWAPPTMAMLYSRKRGERNAVPAVTHLINPARENEKKTRLSLHISSWLLGIDHRRTWSQHVLWTTLLRIQHPRQQLRSVSVIGDAATICTWIEQETLPKYLTKMVISAPILGRRRQDTRKMA